MPPDWATLRLYGHVIIQYRPRFPRTKCTRLSQVALPDSAKQVKHRHNF